ALYATLDANNVIAGTPGERLLQVNADAFVACFGSIRELPDDTPPYDVRFDYNLDGQINADDFDAFAVSFGVLWSY
ncbi:MAG: hypothetical protein WCL32_24365, partial [Planctomycetota bacterium]